MNTVSPEAGTVFGLQLLVLFQFPPAVLVQTIPAALLETKPAASVKRIERALFKEMSLLMEEQTVVGCYV